MDWLGRTGLIDPCRKMRLELERMRSEAGALAAERDAFLHQRDQAIGERNEWQRQRDVAMAERDAFLHQRDQAIGQMNIAVERVARHIHRADMAARRGFFVPAAATRDCIVLFLHIAKTGGVTLGDILMRNFAIEEYLIIDMARLEDTALGWSHLNIERALACIHPREVALLRAVWGHYQYGIQDRIPKPCACVTVLRDPLDRVISHFYSNPHAWRDEHGSDHTIADYISRRQHYSFGFDNNMTRVLSGIPTLDSLRRDATTHNCPRVTDADFEAASKNVDSCLLVGMTDQFDETLVVLGSDLCWSLSDLVYQFRNVTESRPAGSEIAESVRNTILDWNRYDAALVERARAHLARRIACYPGDFQKDLALFRQLNTLFRQGAPVEELHRTEYASFV